jgi:transcriptional regulator with XRE-family HTH domain
MFEALLLDGVSRTEGSQKGFAAKHGISEGTLSRWLRGVVNPLSEHKNATRNQKRLGESLGYSVETLRKLGEISVVDACEIVLDQIDRNARKYVAEESEDIPAELPDV